jgi:MFS family permease
VRYHKPSVRAHAAPATGRPTTLTALQWLICGTAALGFAFDLYEMLVLPIILRPALGALGSLEPGTPDFNRWVGLLFYVPAVVGAAFGLAGGYLTDLVGRRRVLVWSILLYSSAALAASQAATLPQLLLCRCATVVGVSVEYVAAVAWLAELFTDPRQRQRALAYTQSAAGLGGLMASGAYYLAVTYAERLPAIHLGHEPWRYALLFGLAPAIPLLVIRPFLPESARWQALRAKGRLARPSFIELFRPALRQTTVVTTVLFACTYGIVSGVLLQTPRMVPGLPQVQGMAPRQVEQVVGAVQFGAELGVFAGRILFALVVVRIVSQRRLARLFLIPGLATFAFVYFFAATHDLKLFAAGVFGAALLINAPVSLLWSYVPRMYPTHLRGTGEGFAHNIGSRLLGTLAAVATTQLANVMPGAGAPARLAYSAAGVAVALYSVSLIATFALREPASDRLPES